MNNAAALVKLASESVVESIDSLSSALTALGFAPRRSDAAEQIATALAALELATKGLTLELEATAVPVAPAAPETATLPACMPWGPAYETAPEAPASETRTVEATAEPVEKPDFRAALEIWLGKAQEICDTYMKRNFPNQPRMVLELEPGRRYVRVIRNDGTSRSAHCFIDTTNGNVLKPDGWKKPAKGARGNIYTANVGTGPHGALYNR